MTAELQKKLLPIFYYALNPGGLLFLGTSETIGNLTNLFSPVDDKWRIFRRKESASARMGLVELPLSSLSRGEGNLPRTAKAQKDMEIAIPDVAQRILMEHFAPSAVVISEKG